MTARPTTARTSISIRQQDLIQSVADALQYISYYHPVDYIRSLAAAHEREESPAAKDAIAQILTNSTEAKDAQLRHLLAADLPEEALHRGLAHVQAAEFLYEARLIPDLAYTFTHALTRWTATVDLEDAYMKPAPWKWRPWRSLGFIGKDKKVVFPTIEEVKAKAIEEKPRTLNYGNLDNW